MTSQLDVKFTHITDLKNKNYILNFPITVRVETSPGCCIVAIPDLFLWAFSDEKILEDAIKELQFEILDLYDDYLSYSDSELGIIPLQVKKELQILITKI